MLERHTLGNYTHPGDPGEPTTGKPRVSVTDDECRVLAWLARERDVLEIGTGLGVSTRAMASTGNGVVTVDPDPWVELNVVPAFRGMSVLDVKALDDDWLRGRRFDLVFIDGDHSEDAVLRDIQSVLPLLRPGGLVVLHDTNLDGVRRAAESFGTLVRMDTKGHLGMLWVGK